MNGSGRRRRNRSWPEALKREIVAASFEPGASVSVVARRYDVNTHQVLSWRKQYREGLLGSSRPALVPVTVAAEPGSGSAAPGAAETTEIDRPHRQSPQRGQRTP